MSALIITDRRQLGSFNFSTEVFFASEPCLALELLETKDIDRIVFDTRSCGSSASKALENLIADLPVTTRLLAIVEQLPSSPMCQDAGVIYLTPPVNTRDVAWFLESGTAEAVPGSR